MIGTFWNLCRACPAMSIDKSRSEYRSTYQWYEYTGPRQEIIKQAPQPNIPIKSEENGLKNGIQAMLININKKDSGKRLKDTAIDGAGNPKPEVNIKQNPIFDKKEANLNLPNCEAQNGVTINPTVRIRSRNDRRDCAPSRRSKSEGPPGRAKQRGYCAVYGSPSPDRAELPEFEADYVYINNCPNDNEIVTTNVPIKNPRGNTEYRLKFAWPRSKNATDTQEELKPAGGGSRRSAFMATVGHDKPLVPVHRKRTNDDVKNRKGPVEVEPLMDLNGDCENHEDKKDKNPTHSPNERIEFHSEYQKKFRPFSQYDYIAGKFSARDMKVTPSSNLATESWYAEVIELRKKAGEYRHRGWGTELVPQHLAEVYNKQIALWEHVSRRSSLSALTLATTLRKPRALTKAEKTRENNRKFKLNDNRQLSVDRATSELRKKTEKNEETKRLPGKPQRDLNDKHVENNSNSSTAVSTARSQNHMKSSPKKGLSRAASAGSPKKPSPGQQDQSRPTTLATRNIRDTSVLARKKDPLKSKVPVNYLNNAKRNQSHAFKTNDNRTDEIDSVDTENNEPIRAEIERIIKSPPEPTRVKSPEQIMIKSPEPVNWTVPLDTGKTFTVTQNIIPDGDVYHHRPISESKLVHHGLSHPTVGKPIVTPRFNKPGAGPGESGSKFVELSLKLSGVHTEFSPEVSEGRKTADEVALPVANSDLSSDKLSEKEMGESKVNGTQKSLTATSNEELVKPVPVVTEEKLNAFELSGPLSIMNISEPVDNDQLKSSVLMPSRSLDLPEESSIASTPSPTSAIPIADRISSSEVLDSGRNRFDQFWSKSTLNGKELNTQEPSV